MDALRTVTVLEHEVVPVIEGLAAPDEDPLAREGPWFSALEADALLRLNALRPGFCQRTFAGVKLTQYCGIVRLPTCVVEILPKFGSDDDRAPLELESSRSAFLTMLHRGGASAITKLGAVPQAEVHAPLLDIFIEAFLSCALDQARRGLLSRYMAHTDDLPVLKGRFNVHTHYRRNASRPHVLHCEYDDFTADNDHNRAIRHTLDTCRAWISRAACQRLWFEVHTRYANITSVRMMGADVARLPRNRTTHRYDTVLAWCEWLLSILSPALRSGAHEAPGLLFDMNKLFERYVLGLEQDSYVGSHIVRAQGPIEDLADHNGEGAFQLKPDITVWSKTPASSQGSIVKIADAKWKRLNPERQNWGIDPGDIYQLLAYAVRYRCDRLELVYPRPAQASSSLVHGTRFSIKRGTGAAVIVQVKTVSLWDALPQSLPENVEDHALA